MLTVYHLVGGYNSLSLLSCNLLEKSEKHPIPVKVGLKPFIRHIFLLFGKSMSIQQRCRSLYISTSWSNWKEPAAGHAPCKIVAEVLPPQAPSFSLKSSKVMAMVLIITQWWWWRWWWSSHRVYEQAAPQLLKASAPPPLPPRRSPPTHLLCQTNRSQPRFRLFPISGDHCWHADIFPGRRE